MALLILGHPNLESSVANKTIVEELQKSDLNIEVRDIHGLYPDYKIDVNAEQEALLRHDTILFQAPMYWLNVPAILKLWFDEVFAYQFAYGSEGDKLKGKNFILSLTVGASEKEYLLTGRHHRTVYEFTKNIEQTAYYAQMNYVEPVLFYRTSLVAGFSEEESKANIKQQIPELIAKLKQLEIENVGNF